MPRIFLKPNSAEFEEQEKARPESRSCDMPGCDRAGEHKAPKNRGLDEYYEFCMDHVREYNKAWDFFSGMAAHEVEEHMINSIYGDRPTWRYDAEGAAEDILHRKAWQTYQFTEKDPQQTTNTPDMNRNSPEFEAMAIMGLEPPVTFEEAKIRYKELVKKHHPDLNGGCDKSEELLKRINMAYTILKLAYEDFEKLPVRE